MESLPPEIVNMVCKYLKGEDLSAFRVSCKAFAAFAEPYVFKNLHLMFREKSFRNLMKIADHPIYRKYVKSVYYETAMPEYMTLEEWEDTVQPPDLKEYRSQVMKFLPVPPTSNSSEREIRCYKRDVVKFIESRKPINFYSKKQLGDAFAHYVKVRTEVSSLEARNIDLAVIKSAIPRFPNLEQISMSTFCDTSFYEVSRSIQQAYEKTLTLPGMQDKSIENRTDAGVRQMRAMLLAVSSSDIKLESLLSDTTGWAIFDINPDPDDESSNWLPPSILHLMPAFQFLKRIRLSLAVDHFSEPEVSLERQELLGRALKTAGGLETIVIKFGGIRQAREQRGFIESISWERIVGPDHTWRNLKTLYLGVADVSEDFFVEFIQRHAKVLEHLTLDSLWLTQGEWASAFLRLTGMLSHLKKLRFGGIFGFGEPYDDDEIALPMTPDMRITDYDIYPAEELPVWRLGDWLIDFFLHGGPFPLKTIAELRMTMPLEERGAPIDGLDLIQDPSLSQFYC